MRLIFSRLYAYLWTKIYGYQTRFDISYDYIGWDGEFVGKRITNIYAVTECGIVVKEFYGVKS